MVALCVLLAEFDIDKGSTLNAVYPAPLKGLKLQGFAEMMLPTGIHNRDEDWTAWFLNNDQAISKVNISSEEPKVDAFHNVELFRPGSVGLDKSILSSWKKMNTVELQFQPHTCSSGEIDIRMTPSEDDTGDNPVPPICLIQSPVCSEYAGSFTVLDAKDLKEPLGLRFESVREQTRFRRLAYKEILSKPLDAVPEVEDGDGKENSSGGLELGSNFLFGFNLVRTKKVKGLRRGAFVKALAVVSDQKLVFGLRDLLHDALEAAFVGGSAAQTEEAKLAGHDADVAVVKAVYDALQKMDLSSLPNLTRAERNLLRRSSAVPCTFLS